MAIECPDCGSWFKGKACSCGYSPQSAGNAALGAALLNERKAALDAVYQCVSERDKAKLAVIGSVNVVGPRKWAHEILALHEAGLYHCDAGLAMARAVV